MPADHQDVPDDRGEVCWLHVLCPGCGAMPDDEHPRRCWRCGASLDRGEEAAGPRPGE